MCLRYQILFCLVLFATGIHAHDDIRHSTLPARALGGALKDAGLVVKNVFSLNSYAIVATTLPFFAVGGMIDGSLHSCFYDRAHHKNIHQLDPFFSGFARYGVVFEVFLSGVFSLAARNEDLKQTSRLFLVGFPLVGITSDIIKKIRPNREYCLRPWHEDFSKRKRSFGGFPSGHMAVVTYAAALYGMRFGVRAAVPLGAYAFFTAVSFLNCNRHYASQLVAGTSLGFIFAYAVSAVVDEKLARSGRDFAIGPDVDYRGAPAVKVAWRF